MPPHPPSSKSPPSILAPTPATYPHSPAHHTLHWDRIPLWMQIDPYIRLGYRHQLDSLSLCIHSLFYPHNDLVNTWSHLLPALIYLTLLLPNTSYPLPPHHHQGQLIEHLASPQDIAVIRLYILGTAFCLLASAIFHMTSAHSSAIAHRLLKLDYSGICISICVTNISSTHFGLSDKTGLQMLYNTVCILWGLGVLVSLLGPNTDGPGAALFRVCTFLALMLSGFAPVIHMLLVEGSSGVRHFPLLHTAIMALFYLVGTVVYLTHWPEKKWAGTFDIWGASHQIFHVMIAIGQFMFFLGLREAALICYKRTINT